MEARIRRGGRACAEEEEEKERGARRGEEGRSVSGLVERSRCLPWRRELLLSELRLRTTLHPLGRE